MWIDDCVTFTISLYSVAVDGTDFYAFIIMMPFCLLLIIDNKMATTTDFRLTFSFIAIFTVVNDSRRFNITH